MQTKRIPAMRKKRRPRNENTTVCKIDGETGD